MHQSNANNSPNSTSGITVEIRSASLRFAEKQIFHDLNLTLASGSTTCLLGPSGIGKTSLLRLIAGLSAEAKTAHLADADGNALAGRLAYMDQRDLLLPWLTVRDNIALGRRLRGEPVESRRVDDLLAAVDLAEVAESRPATLSVGMRQRAALARTLMEDRALVLMDEPFSSLDALSRLRLQDLAARLLAGRTVLVVTHDPMEALRLGHRILILSGTPARLIDVAPPSGDPPRRSTASDVHERMIEVLKRLGVDQSEQAT